MTWSTTGPPPAPVCSRLSRYSGHFAFAWSSSSRSENLRSNHLSDRLTLAIVLYFPVRVEFLDKLDLPLIAHRLPPVREARRCTSARTGSRNISSASAKASAVMLVRFQPFVMTRAVHDGRERGARDCAQLGDGREKRDFLRAHWSVGLC